MHVIYDCCQHTARIVREVVRDYRIIYLLRERSSKRCRTSVLEVVSKPVKAVAYKQDDGLMELS